MLSNIVNEDDSCTGVPYRRTTLIDIATIPKEYISKPNINEVS